MGFLFNKQRAVEATRNGFLLMLALVLISAKEVPELYHFFGKSPALYDVLERLDYLWPSISKLPPSGKLSWKAHEKKVEVAFDFLHEEKPEPSDVEEVQAKSLEDEMAWIEAYCRFSNALPYSVEDFSKIKDSKEVHRWIDLITVNSFQPGLNALQMESLLAEIYSRVHGNPSFLWQSGAMTALDRNVESISARLLEQMAAQGMEKTAYHLGLARTSHVYATIKSVVQDNHLGFVLAAVLNRALADKISAGSAFHWARFSNSSLESALIDGADDVKSDLVSAIVKAGYPASEFDKLRLVVSEGAAVSLVYYLARLSGERFGDRWLTLERKLKLEWKPYSILLSLKNYSDSHLTKSHQKFPEMDQSLFDAWVGEYQKDHGKMPDTSGDEYKQMSAYFLGKHL